MPKAHKATAGVFMRLGGIYLPQAESTPGNIYNINKLEGFEPKLHHLYYQAALITGNIDRYFFCVMLVLKQPFLFRSLSRFDIHP